MSNYWDQRRSIFCFKIPNPFKFLGEKQRAVGVYAAGAFFAIGWWAFIDAITLASRDPFKEVSIGFEDWISGILTTLGMLVINLIDKSSLHGETFSYSGDSLVWKARLFLFVGFALIAGGLAGSVCVLILKYIVTEVPDADLYYGIGQVAQCGFIMLSTVILWIAQNTQEEYQYNFML
ncbi:Vacuolar protein sorting-associated protein 68 [Umbelopsis sp. WA50703]